MSELSPLANLKNIKKDMENMTYSEKLLHIWTYYRWVLIVVLIFIIVLSVIFASITNLRKTTLLGGVAVNVQLSEEGKTYLTEDYKQIVGTGSKREGIYQSYMDIEAASSASADNYYAVMSLMALCANKEADYLILDQTGFETMLIQGAYLDLNQVYTPEELEAFGDDVIFAQVEENITPVAMALDITDCAFIQDHTDMTGPVYFTYVLNSPRVEECRAFYDYLMAYEG